eukprot:13532848-Alexandrium_andersonii.AAC.1
MCCLPGGGSAGWWAGRRVSPWFGVSRRLVFIGRFGLVSSCRFLVLTGPSGPFGRRCASGQSGPCKKKVTPFQPPHLSGTGIGRTAGLFFLLNNLGIPCWNIQSC